MIFIESGGYNINWQKLKHRWYLSMVMNNGINNMVDLLIIWDSFAIDAMAHRNAWFSFLTWKLFPVRKLSVYPRVSSSKRHVKGGFWSTLVYYILTNMFFQTIDKPWWYKEWRLTGKSWEYHRKIQTRNINLSEGKRCFKHHWNDGWDWDLWGITVTDYIYSRIYLVMSEIW